MQLVYDLIPIFIFFLFYKIAGIYAATASAMVVSCIQVFYYRWRHGKFENMQLITMVLILLLGSATLILHNPIFIKWKPTVIYWVLALVFLVSGLIAKKPLIQVILGAKVELPKQVWQRLNYGWIIFFAFLGLINLYVVYHYSTNTWVNFKLFGILILMIVFVIIQAVYLAKHITDANDGEIKK